MGVGGIWKMMFIIDGFPKVGCITGFYVVSCLGGINTIESCNDT